ncbi:exported hypothetical protein [Rhodococcus sp. RD6.2]|uniref:hypothetical protein n=1 Tax=Rhodococcus sp. RD6.2 TaxID=260936 RepID=UPI00063B2D4B|nr:hypothetical protein [Rhodococcus sp. RD6.2]CRK50665.1 exported hypothetical protein [Rhodococcus sp. RD6.2]
MVTGGTMAAAVALLLTGSTGAADAAGAVMLGTVVWLLSRDAVDETTVAWLLGDAAVAAPLFSLSASPKLPTSARNRTMAPTTHGHFFRFFFGAVAAGW